MNESNSHDSLALGLIVPPTILPAHKQVEIIPGHLLRCAAKHEVPLFCVALHRSGFGGDPLVPFLAQKRHDLWGTDDPIAAHTDDTEHFFVVIERLQRDRTSGLSGFRDFDRAVMLANIAANPRVPLIAYGNMGFSGWAAAEQVWPWDSWKPTDVDFSQISEANSLVSMLDAHHERIHQSLELFWRLPREVNPIGFQFVMLFSVIECLLTHSTPGSISRQIKYKMPLVLKRARQAGNPFGCSDQTAWEELYGIRNTVAHGGHPEFRTGKAQHLPDWKESLNFLQQSTAAVLRQSLREPDLVEDLAEL